MTSQFSLEFYNYFMPLDLQSIINYLFGLACAKSLGEEKKRRDRKRVQMKEEAGRALKTEKRVHRVQNQLYRCHRGLKVAVCGGGTRKIKQIYRLLAVVEFGTGSGV